MDKNYTIEILEEEASDMRTLYIESGGVEWVRLVITLKALIEEYSSDKLFDKVAICNKEIDEIMNNVLEKKAISLIEPRFSESVNTYYDEINEWAAESDKCKLELQSGGSYTKYANTINGLCNYLCLARQFDIALLKYEEALQILLSNHLPDCDKADCMYNTIVILLKASMCALELGNNNLSRRYSVYSLQYLTENNTKWSEVSLVRWNYVVDLCKELANKHT